MKISDLIEEYIKEIITENDVAELNRSTLADMFNCVPSQINYVISTRFIPELGFYVESRRGGGGYIKISRVDSTKEEYISNITEKIGSKLSQSVIDIYLDDFIRYNLLDKNTASLLRVALSDKSLSKVDKLKRDEVRAEMFKTLDIKDAYVGLEVNW